jgi:putative nucleotidyltransferase with HDIG domain
MANAHDQTKRPFRIWPSRETLLQLLHPERLLSGTPYGQMWREREASILVLSGRAGLVAISVALVLHHFLVDVPLHKTPVHLWMAYRFGGGIFFLLLALLYRASVFRRLPWVRTPLFVGILVISTLEAKAVEWSPTVPYFYAFVLALAGVLLLRQSITGSLASFAACVAAQWAIAWRVGTVGRVELVSVTLVAAILIVLFRARMGADIGAFVSEKRELDAQKKLIETQIELDRVKTNFFTNVSHELRTPLTLVIAPLEAALRGPRALAPELRDDLDLALRNAQRLLGEINTLLDLSRLDARRERLLLEPADAIEVVAELVESGRRLAESKHIDLTFAPDVPFLTFPFDRQKLEKVVLNLLSNALRFTDGHEGRRGRVAVRCGQRGDRFYCIVEDSGLGIPEEHLARIFDRFHQVDGAQRLRRGGTGIGLSLVKELVDLHMGSVHVWSRPGEGSAFTVELPVDPAVYPAERLSPHDAPPRDRDRPSLAPVPFLSTVAPDAKRRPGERRPPFRSTVLVVDDNLELLEYVSRQLAEEFRTRTASNAEDALRAIGEELPDLVVSDMMMPGRSGAELLRELRSKAATRHIPVVLLTARSDPESRVDALEGGADEYMAKPFNPMELRARIRSLLVRGRMERELTDRNAYLAKVNLDLVLSKRKVLIETMEAFALAVEAKDPYTHGHSRRVSLLAERVCRELGLGPAACETIRIAGILHDIGKIGMPEQVLRKPGRLSAPEYEIFKRHPQLGSRIVSAVTELEEVGRAILHHHERWDGKGYPDRLAGEQIPVLSRILTVCDTYDAMTSERPYRRGVPHARALDEIARCQGSQLDPAAAQAFLQLYAARAPEFPAFAPRLDQLVVAEELRSAGA